MAPTHSDDQSTPQADTLLRIAKDQLEVIVSEFRTRGYRAILPKVADGAVIYDEAENISQLPIGVLDEQEGGTYRLKPGSRDGFFDYVVGPHSVKRYLFPPTETVLHADRIEGSWQFMSPSPASEPTVIVGVRSCDLHAIAIQDRVFLEGPYVDQAYKARREKLALVAVNCRRAASTCFCHSMGTGPVVTKGCDLALTELDDAFAVEIGTSLGGEVINACRSSSFTAEEVRNVRQIPLLLRQKMEQGGRGFADEQDMPNCPDGRDLDTDDIRNLLVHNLEHPRWENVAQRCLSCANCTLVCPTCFCSSIEDVTDLAGEHIERERSWGSCFTAEHSYMNSGIVRNSTRSRYRQWLVHKLATWIDQFDTSGCVGCGRCITWCPVGIDLTQEVAAIRGDQP
ncbi:sulfite reductase subunit A [Blastopirellula marina]|uniref:Sulfite reductase subunit A n=1 Tax=Blastopirellula marina TaxID=124 RepID=A0A2S8F0F4_9BACT|nr:MULTISPECIES: 4Fe-4S dicluster domain-containing protein [Pirellulaceae]PQO25636.1 sulfite reductase subunit A [Blastopirellula marina]RCS43319.1 sulfite reductase subunit A [Bremerella cremea]